MSPNNIYNKLNRSLLKKLRAKWDPYLEREYVQYPFHNIDHVNSCTSIANDIIESENMPEEDAAILLTAILFHDIELKTNKKDHEALSAAFADRELQKLRVDPDIILRIRGCIMSTKHPQNPQNALEDAICDCDRGTLGKRNCFIWSLRDYEEKYIYFERMSLKEYYEGLIKFMESTKWHSRWGQINLTRQKEENLIFLKKKLEIIKEHDSIAQSQDSSDENPEISSISSIKRSLSSFIISYPPDTVTPE